MNWRKRLCLFFVAVSLVAVAATISSAAVSGDVDDDGVVRLADTLLILRHLVGTQPLTSPQLYACDVAGNGSPLPAPDGGCDIVDAVTILNKAFGLIGF